MATLDQIQKIHDELGHADTLGSYLRALRSVGVGRYSSYLNDGHSEYYCSDGATLNSDSVHEPFTVSDKVDKKNFLATMKLSESGEIGYLEMSKRLADSGVERWTFNTQDLTISYVDKTGGVIQKEPVRDTR